MAFLETRFSFSLPVRPLVLPITRHTCYSYFLAQFSLLWSGVVLTPCHVSCFLEAPATMCVFIPGALQASLSSLLDPFLFRKQQVRIKIWCPSVSLRCGSFYVVLTTAVCRPCRGAAAGQQGASNVSRRKGGAHLKTKNLMASYSQDM